MHRIEGVSHRGKPLEDFINGLLTALFGDAFAQVAAAKILDHCVGHVARATDLIVDMGARVNDRKNRGMLVVREVPDFLQEALTEGAVHHQTSVRDLYYDLALEGAIPSEIDRPHPPAIEGFLDLVAIVEQLTNEGVLAFSFLGIRYVDQACSSPRSIGAVSAQYRRSIDEVTVS